jgi:hypothetical protein
MRAARRRWLTPSETFVLPPLRMLRSHATVRATAINAEGPDQRTQTLGALLLDLAATDDVTLTRRLTELTAEYAAGVIFSIREQLNDASLPASWKEALSQWLVSPTFKLDPESLTARIASTQAVRSMAREYGRALQAWPQLWSYCRDRFR